MDKMKNVPMIEARNIVFCEYYTRGMVGVHAQSNLR